MVKKDDAFKSILKNISSSLNIFGTPSDLSPLIICSRKNTIGSALSPIKLFNSGLYWYTSP